MGGTHNILLVLMTQLAWSKADLGFVHMQSSQNEIFVEECSNFNPSFAKYPAELNATSKGIPVYNVYPGNGCNPPGDPSVYKGHIVFMKREPNCTFAERARIAQESGGEGILIVSDSGFIQPGANQTDYDEIDITVSVITNDSYKIFHELMDSEGIANVVVKQYAPPSHFYDPNSLVMWILAIFACASGAWMQASFYQSQLNEARSPRPSSGGDNNGKHKGSDEMDFSVMHAVIFFGMCSVTILLMYFFYDYLVYFIIAVFCLASCLAMFDLSYNTFKTSSCFVRHRLPPNKLPLFRYRPPILAIFLFLLCAGISVFWAVNRKESWAWILQDILGFTFCVHMIKQIRLPNFKVSSILLILFFVYDIFYVFITPLFTKNKESIMVQVATGGEGATEELPMLFKLPRFLPSIYNKCGPLPFSMLGYGDVILPGIHVGFCAVWDSKISNTVKLHSYYIAAVIAYGVGLILTFVGMYLMMTGQPALLYLTPCCLISTLIVAIKRRELKNIWSGKTVPKPHTLASSSVENPVSERESLLVRNEA